MKKIKDTPEYDFYGNMLKQRFPTLAEIRAEHDRSAGFLKCFPMLLDYLENQERAAEQAEIQRRQNEALAFGIRDALEAVGVPAAAASDDEDKILGVGEGGINITQGIPSEIYVAIGRGRYEDDYELAQDICDHFHGTTEHLRKLLFRATHGLALEELRCEHGQRLNVDCIVCNDDWGKRNDRR